MPTKTSNPKDKIITIFFEDKPVQVNEGITVAAAVQEHLQGYARINQSGLKRGPYCHMGLCFECLMNIDNQPNQQACLTIVADGMRVRRQNGLPDFNQKGGDNE